MEDKKTILKSSINPGLIAGFSLILINLIAYIVGIDIMNNSWLNIFFYILYFFVIFISQKKYRDNINDNSLSLGEAIKIGITIAMIGGILMSIYNSIFTTYISPDFIENTLHEIEKQLVINDPNISDNQLDIMVNISRKTMSPKFAIPIEIISHVFRGFIISLISGFFVKKNKI